MMSAERKKNEAVNSLKELLDVELDKEVNAFFKD